MKWKTLITAILVGAAVGGVAFYLLRTKSGKKEWQRLKKTGKATADAFKTLGEEVARNAAQESKEERANEWKAFVRETLAV